MIEIKEVPPVPGEPTYTLSGLSKRDLEAIKFLFYYKKQCDMEYTELSRALGSKGWPPKLSISGEW